MPQSAPNPTTPYLAEAGLGDSVLKALAATTPELPRVRLDSGEPATTGEPPASAGGLSGGSTAPEHRYQIEGEIARGGMGAVLRGRDEDLGREIALKVMLETHRGKTELLQRFVEEAQIAGQLQHPGITPVYELGQFPDRRPYFTMKLVRGQTLAALLASPGRESGGASAEQPHPHPPADAGGSPSRTRFLKIFEQICQTLAYAHARRVLHRDLKPANIMVGAYGEVQVMDWGLAKVLGTPASPGRESGGASASQPRSHPLAHAGGSPAEDSVRTKSATPETEAGSVLGTPSYMAPEQARGEIDQLDERADVFGLGAILCEILTGKPPYVGASGVAIYQKAAAGDLADAFARLDQSGADADLIALAKRALAANPNERPRDAGALTAELTAYLNGVEQRLKKAELAAAQAKTKAEEETKRRQLTFKLAAAILVTLLAGLAGSLWFLNRSLAAEKLAKANEDQAVKLAAAENKQRRISDAVRSFLQEDLLAQADARKQAAARGDRSAPTENPRVEELLDRAAAALAPGRIDAKFPAQQEVQAALLRTVGDAYRAIGRHAKAIPLLERAQETFEKQLGSSDRATLGAKDSLASALREAGELTRAIELSRAVAAAAAASLGENDPDACLARANAAGALLKAGRFPEAIAEMKALTARLGAEHDDTLALLNNLALAELDAGHAADAAVRFAELRRLRTAKLGARHPDTLLTLANQAAAHVAAEEPQRAIPLLEEAHAGEAATLGAEHPSTLVTLGNLAGAYQSAGDPKKAVELLEAVRRAQEKRLPTDHSELLVTLNNLARAYRGTGRVAEAIALYEQVRQAQERRLPSDHPDLLTTLHNLGRARLAAGQTQEGAALLEQTLAAKAAKLGPDHPDTLTTLSALASARRAAKQWEAAIDLLDRLQAAQLRRYGADHPDTLTSWAKLGACCAERKRDDLALPWYRKAAEGLERRRFADPAAALILRDFAACLERAGQAEEARAWLKKLPASSPK